MSHRCPRCGRLHHIRHGRHLSQASRDVRGLRSIESGIKSLGRNFEIRGENAVTASRAYTNGLRKIKRKSGI